MTWYWFPDNTVLVNFASVSRLPLLKEILRGRGRWTEAIAHEAEQSARFHPDLKSVALDGWLGAPIEIDDPQEATQIERVRCAVFGGTPHEPLKHLGEAQTCHVLRYWQDFAGSYWITDDRDAREYAKRAGITTLDTADLISEGVIDACCTRRDGFEILQAMRLKGNRLRIPPSQAHL